MGEFSRRELLKTGGLAGMAAAIGGAAPAAAQGRPSGDAQAAADREERFSFFTAEEARFVGAAVDRLIPADEEWGGAREAGVLGYIDRQLAGAYGAGARMYLNGPWDPQAPPEQGYQLRYAPRDLYRTAIGEIRGAVRDSRAGREFWDLGAEEMDAVLAELESGAFRIPSLPTPVFFETLLANTVEGFFSDPVYGGNRDMISWRMIGFPGAYGQYVELVDKHDISFERSPVGIANADAVLGHPHKH